MNLQTTRHRKHGMALHHFVMESPAHLRRQTHPFPSRSDCGRQPEREDRQFLTKPVRILVIESFENFEGFLHQHRLESFARLFPIPGTPVWSSESPSTRAVSQKDDQRPVLTYFAGSRNQDSMILKAFDMEEGICLDGDGLPGHSFYLLDHFLAHVLARSQQPGDDSEPVVQGSFQNGGGSSETSPWIE